MFEVSRLSTVNRVLSVFQVFSAEKETLITTVVAYLESKDIAYM